MNIAFWDNSLCERGTTVSLFDYAYYNQKLLNNKSFVFYDKNHHATKRNVVENFKKHFIVHETDNFKEVDHYIKLYNITHIYIIKGGGIDNRLSLIAKNCIHCVFNCDQPHGDVYATISKGINNGQYPVVPHMINLPNHDGNMKKELGIPETAIVFGGYGGTTSFSIPFVHNVVYQIAKNNPNIYFLFANFNTFCPSLPNIIHLPMILDTLLKVKFINTCDAMLWARHDGESFGIAIGEFSSKNKPVIAMKIRDLSFVELLKDKAISYKDHETFMDILLEFKPDPQKDWNAYTDYTPEKVMEIFNNVYLKN